MRRDARRGLPGLSHQLLQWIAEKIPPDDPIRISSLENHKFIQILGDGRFGEVRKYMDENTMINEAVKCVKMSIFDHGFQDEFRLRSRLEVFLKELRRLCQISNQSNRIANFLGFYADDKQLLVMTEFLPNGSVKDRLAKEAIPEFLALKYLREAAKGLNYLHSLDSPIVHTDIKAANLLITISDSIKLTNFGLVRDLAIDGFGSNVASDIAFDFRGTLLYAAPEVLTSKLGPGHRKTYGKPADIWALGCTFIEMLVRFPPHYEYFGHVKEVLTEVIDRATGPEENWLPYSADILIPTCSERAARLVDNMFERDIGFRPSSRDLLRLIDEEEEEMQPTTSQANESPPKIRRSFSLMLLKKVEHVDEEELIPLDKKKDLKKIPDLGDLYLDPKTEEEEEILLNVPDDLRYIPMETLENGAVRRKRTDEKTKKKRQKTSTERLAAALQYYASRILYFLSLLSSSVLYVLIFLIIGLGALSFFLFLSYCIVLGFRYLIQLRCQCDLAQPQYLIISGILLILLFALLFSCCMVALGEYKYRMANKGLRDSRFFVPRPDKDFKICGITLLEGKQSSPELPENIQNLEADDMLTYYN